MNTFAFCGVITLRNMNMFASFQRKTLRNVEMFTSCHDRLQISPPRHALPVTNAKKCRPLSWLLVTIVNGSRLPNSDLLSWEIVSKLLTINYQHQENNSFNYYPPDRTQNISSPNCQILTFCHERHEISPTKC